MRLIATLTFAFVLCGLAVVLSADSTKDILSTCEDGSITVETGQYKVVFDKKKGYTLSRLQDKSVKRETALSGGFELVEDGTQDVYNGHISKEAKAWPQRGVEASCKILQNSSDAAALEVKWSLPVAEVVEKISCRSGDRLIAYEIEIERKETRRAYARFEITCNGFSSPEGEAFIHPQGLRRPLKSTDCPGYAFAWNPKTNFGFGLSAAADSGLSRVFGDMKGKKEGFGGEATQLWVSTPSLVFDAPRSRSKFCFAVIVGGKPEETERQCQPIGLDKAFKVTSIENVWPDKIVFKPGEKCGAVIQLAGRSDVAKKVLLRTRVLSGLDAIRVIDEREVELGKGEKRDIRVEWESAKVDQGCELRAELLDGGAVVDAGREYFAVATSGVKVGQYGCVNPGCFNDPAKIESTMREYRMNYFGAFEYYTWTPCPYLGLTPGESWEPHTESQPAYRCRVERRFVQSFVEQAHKNGISVFPWMNGEVSLETGLDHPEFYRYGKDGQPLLYNGVIDNGKRYAIAYSSAMYDEKRAYEWGKMMSDSIDMFGWDGCRFDWAFTPSVVGDPMRAKETEWFDYTGKSCLELYPNPDAQGTKCLRAFLKGVWEKHPEFMYGTNSDFSEEWRKNYPQYREESSRNSFLWFEYLLGYNAQEMRTWNLWVGRLVGDSASARRNGAQVGVGWMRPCAPGSASRMLMPYAMAFSGIHWIAPGDRTEPLGNDWKVWRHALRFAECYYDTRFSPVAADEVAKRITVENADDVMWRPWLSERMDKNERTLALHLLNTSGDINISEFHPKPPVRKDVSVIFKKEADEKIKSVHLLISEPYPHAEQLAVDDSGHIRIPSLEWGASVVVTFEREGK